MGNKVIITIPAKENDEFIKSNANNLVSILREYEVTSVSNDLQCSMPFNSPPLPYTDVLGDEIIDIDLPSKDQVDTLSMGDRKIDFNPLKDVEILGSFLANDHVPVLRMFDEPLEDGILYLEILLNEDTSSDLSPILLPK
ncbi:hypothetical protein Tco_1116135 [Tanacetum coccineum]